MMWELFVGWIGDVSMLEPDVLFLFVAVASMSILDFLLDFFRYIMYHISQR